MLLEKSKNGGVIMTDRCSVKIGVKPKIIILNKNDPNFVCLSRLTVIIFGSVLIIANTSFSLICW